MTPSRSPGVARRHTSRPRTLISILATALVALALALAACAGGGSAPSVSSTPTATAEETAAPTPTVEPTVAPTPQPTPEPIAQWTGLRWSDPVIPPFTIHLTDLVPWSDGYVAAGWVETNTGAGGALLTSLDGLNWTVAFRTDPASDRWPRQVLVLGDQLLAFTNPNMDTRLAPDARPPIVWRSTDGTSWTLVESASWRDAWAGLAVGPMPASWDHTQYDIPTGLVDVASGPDGVVAIGNSIVDEGLIPVVLHSTDGRRWSQVSLPAGTVSPLLNEVVGYDGGFVLVGATGVGADPSSAMPAAWTSVDGLTWTRATVAGDDVTGGGELGIVHAGSDGMVACFGPREMFAGGRRFTAPWFSTDGLSWRGPSQADPDQACAPMDSDGVRMVAVPNTYHPDTGQWSPIEAAWVSTDAETWIELPISAPMTDQTEAFWVAPEGVIYAGVESFWFGAAQAAE